MNTVEITDDTHMGTQAGLDAAKPARGKKSFAAPPEADEVARYAAAAAPIVAELRRESVTLLKGELAQSLSVAQAVGSIKAFQFSETINRVAMLKQLSELREGKAYKGASLLMPGGQSTTVNTWEEFCDAFGYSHKKINEDLQNLATFGGSLLEAQEALGLGYRDLRRLRAGIKALPPDEQQKVLADIKDIEGSDEAKDRLDDLRIKLSEVEIALNTAKADMTAKETVSKAKSAKIDDLNERIAKLTSLSPDEQQARRDGKALEARKALDLACHNAVGQIDAVVNAAATILRDGEMGRSTHSFVHARVGLMCDLMAEIILNRGIDIDFSTRFVVDYGPDGDPTLRTLDDADGPDQADAETNGAE